MHIICYLFFYPFRDESDWNVCIPRSYTSKIAAAGVIKIIYSNRVLIEPFIDAVHEELLQYGQTK